MEKALNADEKRDESDTQFKEKILSVLDSLREASERRAANAEKTNTSLCLMAEAVIASLQKKS